MAAHINHENHEALLPKCHCGEARYWSRRQASQMARFAALRLRPVRCGRRAWHLVEAT